MTLGGSAPAEADSPYIGLDYFTESEAEWFYGRERDTRTIVANLTAARLTLLYAQSGVGKSSLLRAGVAHQVAKLATSRLAEGDSPGYVPVVFSAWTRATHSSGSSGGAVATAEEDPVRYLVEAIENALPPFLGDKPRPTLPRDALDTAIAQAAEAVGARLLIILDQFEEHLLYRTRSSVGASFVEKLATCINRADLRANFVIAIREDYYAALGDVFAGKIANVYGNYLQLQYLDRAAAREAVENPIEHYNRHYAQGRPITVGDGLVDEVLDGVRKGAVDIGHGGQGAQDRGNGTAQRRDEIETPYLQLVMTALWARERDLGSRTIRVETLKELGGAQAIVRRHLDRALDALPDQERDTALDIFRYLVTASGSKIVYGASDLAAMGDPPPASEEIKQRNDEILGVLKQLDAARIVRHVDPPAGRSEPDDRYEIFSDVLAPAIVDWRTRGLEQRRRAREEGEREKLTREKQAAVRRARISIALAASAVGLLLVAVIAFVIAEHQRTQANAARATARSRALAAQALTDYQGPLGRGLLLAIEAYRSAPTAEARGALVGGLVKTQGMLRYLKAQTGPINSVAFDPAGDRLASGSVDGSVVLWNLASERRQTLPGDSGTIYSVAFSPDGAMLASGSYRVALWDLTTGRRRLLPFPATDAPATSVGFDPARKIVAAGGAGGSVILWNEATGRQLRTLPVGSRVNAIAYSPDGRTIATGDADGDTIIWSTRTGRQLHVLPVPGGGAVNGISFSPKGGSVAAADDDGNVYVWQAGTGREVGTLSDFGAAVESVAFSPSGRTILAGGSDDDVRTWSAATLQLERTFQGHTGTVETVAFSPNGRSIASGADDDSVILWQAAPAAGARTLRGSHGDIFGVAFNPSGRTLAAANADRTVSLWDIASGRERILHGNRGAVDGVAFSADGDELASADEDGTVVVWNAATTERQLRISDGDPNNGLTGVAFSPDGRLLVAGSIFGDVFVWDARTGDLLRTLHGQAGVVHAVAFAPDETLASAGADGTIVLWNPGTGRRLRTLTGLGASVEDVAFSPGGKLLASASDDGTVTLWDAPTGAQLGAPLRGHQAQVYTVAFGPDGRTLASGSGDHTVIVWNLSTRLGEPLGGHADIVNSVAYSPNGTLLASGSDDGTIILHARPPAVKNPAAIYARVCGIVRNNLTPAEWREFVPGVAYQQTCPGYR